MPGVRGGAERSEGMTRRLFRIASAVSLVLWCTTVVLWVLVVRNHPMEFGMLSTDQQLKDQPTRSYMMRITRGGFELDELAPLDVPIQGPARYTSRPSGFWGGTEHVPNPAAINFRTSYS